MSLETIVLIGILTLLAIGLGADFWWNVFIKPTFLDSNNLSCSETTVDVIRQTTQLILAVFLLVFIGAIILNIIPNSRLESYLLKIGLLSLIIVSFLILVEFAQINRATSQELLTSLNLLIWIRLIVEMVAYWSFLHYALNPKI